MMGHEYFAEVSEDFIEDDFNLTGLQAQVPMYKDALEMILDVEPSESGSEMSEEEEEEEEEDDGLLGDELDEPVQNGSTQQSPRRTSGLHDGSGTRRHTRHPSDTSVIESSAELLYGLIHARFITSRPGIQQMWDKYEHNHFGVCPRVYCHGARVVPVGLSDTPGQQTVKLFCPSCLDVYTPPNSRFQAVDGAFFGSTFGCLFFMTFPDIEVAPRRKNRDPLKSEAATTTANNNNDMDDAEGSVLSPTETNTTQPGGMTASRSSSLTLAQPPNIVSQLQQQQQAQKEEKAAAAAAALPPQPLTINGVATANLAPGLGKGRIYEPKIYGFRVSERAKSGPRMRWLRSKPLDMNELDESRRWHEQWGGNVDGDDVDIDLDDENDENGLEEEGVEDAEGDAADIERDRQQSRQQQGGKRDKGDSRQQQPVLEDKDGDRVMESASQSQIQQQQTVGTQKNSNHTKRTSTASATAGAVPGRSSRRTRSGVGVEDKMIPG